jgi:signal peptidase I
MSNLHIEPIAPKSELKDHLYPNLWHEVKDFVFYFTKVGVMVAVIFLFLRSSVIDKVQISGQSMFPNYNFTPNAKDEILIDKITPKFGGFFRGQVVVAIISDNACIAQKELLIKRVIGLPGEKVSIKDGSVYITNSEHPNSQKLEEKDYLGPNIKTYKNITEPDSQITEEQTLGPDQYYIMGDNRSNSVDSRSCGAFDRQQIIGQEWVRISPTNQAGFFKLPKYNINNLTMDPKI